MHYTGTIWRPPYEAWSGLLQVTAGCTHHKCKFCTLYEELPFKFRLSPMEEIEEDIKEIYLKAPNITRLFLTGANPFVLSPDKLKKIAYAAKQYLHKLDSIGCFARITDISPKTVIDLKELRTIGYNRITIGVETADDSALKFMNKGYSSSDILEQCRKLDEANMEYDFFYLAGISGRNNGVNGAVKSAQIFNLLNPKIIGVSMLTIFGSSPLHREIKSGNWSEESETEKLSEISALIQNLNINTHFAALGASNMVNFHGDLPSDKLRLTNMIKYMIEQFGEKELAYYRANLRHL